MPKIKPRFIEPHETRSDKIGFVIEFVPMVKQNVGIGYIDWREATTEDLNKHPIVARPWVNKDGVE